MGCRRGARAGFARRRFLRIGQQAFPVKRGGGTGHDKVVLHAACAKAAMPESAHFHGAIDQLIVVLGAVVAKAVIFYFDSW